MGKHTIDAKDEILVVGDLVRFQEAVFSHYVDSFKHPYKNKPCGYRYNECEIIGESFGKKTKIRTLKLLVSSSTGLWAYKPHIIIHRHARTLHQRDLWRQPREHEHKEFTPAWWV